MKGLLTPLIGGLLIWLFAISFFIFLGDQVLVGPNDEEFILSMGLLIIGTIICLVVVFYLYRFLDRSRMAGIKLGIIGTSIGLLLDSYSLIFHKSVFPNLAIEQVLSFTVWMAIAYAFYLLIPLFIYIMQERSEHR